MAILVLAEQSGGALKPSALNAVSAAARIGGDIHVLVPGAGGDVAAAAAQAAGIAGVAKVLSADAPQLAHGLAEPLAALIVALAPGYSHVVAAADTTGKNVLPRAAALSDSQQISDIVEVVSADTFVRPIYAGAALATVQSSDAIKFITARVSAFPAAATGAGPAAIEAAAVPADPAVSSFVGAEVTKSERPELTAARIVVTGGRGMGSKENFALIETLADTLSAAVGASRAAVDAGFAPNDLQVGQTGKIVAPDLYIAVGVSGAIQHLAGMKDSKVVVAINKDEEAPIFQVADYGLVADLFQALPELTKEIGA